MSAGANMGASVKATAAVSKRTSAGEMVRLSMGESESEHRAECESKHERRGEKTAECEDGGGGERKDECGCKRERGRNVWLSMHEGESERRSECDDKCVREGKHERRAGATAASVCHARNAKRIIRRSMHGGVGTRNYGWLTIVSAVSVI
jgi:hypothetical protein